MIEQHLTLEMRQMGDRASVGVTEYGETVYLYTHHGGSELEGVVRETMGVRRDRWSDGAYLARMLFEAMIDEQNDRGGELGFGIMGSPSGEEDPLIVLNCDNQTVTVTGRGACKDVPFSDYVIDGAGYQFRGACRPARIGEQRQTAGQRELVCVRH